MILSPASRRGRPSIRGKQRPASTQLNRARAVRILRVLVRTNVMGRIELDFRTPFELLVATILSAQCTDQRVNQVTPALFRRFPRPATLAKANPREVEKIIRSTGFYRAKAKNLIACARVLAERYGGEIPHTMEALTSLPGVGRKTANVVLGNAFGQPGVIVDTHVTRVANRLRFTRSGDPIRIENDLQQLIPLKQWTTGSQTLLLHGRYVCVARTPKCNMCSIYEECDWEGKRPR